MSVSAAPYRLSHHLPQNRQQKALLCYLGIHSWVVVDACTEQMMHRSNFCHAGAGLVFACGYCGVPRSRDVRPQHPDCCHPFVISRVVSASSPKLGSWRSYTYFMK